MGRRYTIKDAEQLIEYAKNNVKNICIGSDIIVGFPGEDHDHFEMMNGFLKKAPIDYFHVFSFSKRPNAKASEFKNQVPCKVIHSRSESLRRLSRRKRAHFFQTMLEKTVFVLFEQEKNGEWLGLTDNFIRVSVLSNKNLKNRFCRVKLIDIKGQTTRGKLFSRL